MGVKLFMNHSNISEKQLEDLLTRYPYLLDSSFQGKKIERQVKIELNSGSIGRIDMVINGKYAIHVIELKVEPITMAHIGQLGQYVNFYKKKSPNREVIGYLIGSEASEDILKKIQLLGYKFLQIDRDFPIRIKLCENCRLAYDRKFQQCPSCQSQNYL